MIMNTTQIMPTRTMCGLALTSNSGYCLSQLSRGFIAYVNPTTKLKTPRGIRDKAIPNCHHGKGLGFFSKTLRFSGSLFVFMSHPLPFQSENLDYIESKRYRQAQMKRNSRAMVSLHLLFLFAQAAARRMESYGHSDNVLCFLCLSNYVSVELVIIRQSQKKTNQICFHHI
jgi:hypothetical protein